MVAGPQPVYTGGDGDAGGQDQVAASADAAVAAAAARRGELEADTFGQGSVIGDVMDLPPVNSDFSKRTGGSGAGQYRPPGAGR